MFPYCGASLSLDACVFPNLQSFATTMEPHTLASFVRRHPQLQELHISPSDLRSIPLSEFSGISLSSLNSVCLPESLLFMISPDAPLQSVLSPEIEDDNEDIPNFIRHLSRYYTTLSELHLCRPHWNAEVLMHVATLLPNIKSFTFTRMIPGRHHHSNLAVSCRCAPKAHDIYECSFSKHAKQPFLFSAPSVNYASKLHAVENYRALLLCVTIDATSRWFKYGATNARPSVYVPFQVRTPNARVC